jgi:hypothetical protein
MGITAAIENGNRKLFTISIHERGSDPNSEKYRVESEFVGKIIDESIEYTMDTSTGAKILW